MNEFDQELSDLKQAEEAKREALWNPQERWRVIQETITWAEAQLTVRRNDRASRLREQAEKLAGVRAKSQDGS